MKDNTKQIANNQNTASKISVPPGQCRYREYLLGKFNQTNSYEEFINKIEQELEERYEIKDWAFAFLHLPDKLVIAEHFGTVDIEYISEFLERGLEQHDLILQNARVKDSPIFQTDIYNAIVKSDLYTHDTNMWKKYIYQKNIERGLHEICCIPIRSSFDGKRCLFTVTSKGINRFSNFKKLIINNMHYLIVLASTINEVGMTSYKKHFFQGAETYNTLVNSQPLNLLATMVKYDLDVGKAASKLKISYNTAKKHIATIKAKLNATTIHGAHERARQNQYIE